jgi:hypothetical protein
MTQTSILVPLNAEVQGRLTALAEERQQPIAEVAADILAMYVDSWEMSEELLSSLDLAEQAVDADESEEYSVESLHTLVDSIQKRGMARLVER